VDRIKIRRDFVSAARGRKVSRPAFVLQARRRDDGLPNRIGFTVTKRTAKKAVERNRIRRRLKEACAAVAGHFAGRGVDYVLIGRRPALTIPFADLKSDLAAALSDLAARMNSGETAGQDMRRAADG